MTDAFDGKRRRFMGLCAAGLAALGGLPTLMRAAESPRRDFATVRLVHPDGQPFHARDLERGRNYVFSYPYVSTPCFLLDLGRPLQSPTRLQTREGREYVWPGGVGLGHSVVAFSAICPHRMTHPAPQTSLISYHAHDHEGPDGSGAGVIHCCSEGSVFDPGEGGRVLDGPAPEPLAAIDLRYDVRDDTLLANGAHGGVLFERFLDAFGMRLALTFGEDRYDRPVGETSVVQTLEAYSDRPYYC